MMEFAAPTRVPRHARKPLSAPHEQGNPARAPRYRNGFFKALQRRRPLQSWPPLSAYVDLNLPEHPGILL